jgi:hypothetical protein
MAVYRRDAESAEDFFFLWREIPPKENHSSLQKIKPAGGGRIISKIGISRFLK